MISKLAMFHEMYKAGSIETWTEDDEDRQIRKVQEARTSLVASLKFKSMEEKIDWSKTQSSSSGSLVAESFSVSKKSLLSTRADSFSKLSLGNQWLTLAPSKVGQTPLVLFFKEVGILSKDGALHPYTNQSDCLKEALYVLEQLLEQEKMWSMDEKFDFDDLSKLDLQLQSLAYRKFCHFLNKSKSSEILFVDLKKAAEEEAPEAQKIAKCKDLLKRRADHTLYKILNSLFLNTRCIKEKAQSLFLESSPFLALFGARFSFDLSAVQQWSIKKAFEHQANQIIYPQYQAKLKQAPYSQKVGLLRILDSSLMAASYSISDAIEETRESLKNKEKDELRRVLDGEECGDLLETRIEDLMRAISCPPKEKNTLYDNFSLFHSDFTRKYHDFDPLHKSLVEVAYAENNSTVLGEICDPAVLRAFIQKHIGGSKPVYPVYQRLWDEKMNALSKEKGSPFELFLTSRGFFEKQSQSMSVDFKYSRLVSYQSLFRILISMAAERLEIPDEIQTNDLLVLNEYARHVAFICFLLALPLVEPPLDQTMVDAICNVKGDVLAKEKINEAKALLDATDHPKKSALLTVLTGAFIGDGEAAGVIKAAFSLEVPQDADSTLGMFFKQMQIKDRLGASFDENYFEKVEAITRFKNYVLTQVEPSLDFAKQLKNLKVHDLAGMDALFLQQEKSSEWISGMLKQLDEDVEWLKQKAEDCDIPELKVVLSLKLTGHFKMITLSKGFYLLQAKLKNIITEKKLPPTFGRFVEESCLAENRVALDHVIRNIERT